VIIAGMGVAGMSCAYYAALRGHRVTIYGARNSGGQFNLAAKIPGKQDYIQTVHYFESQLDRLGVTVYQSQPASFVQLRDVYADAIVIATGVCPEKPDIPGIDHFSVMDYESAILNHSEIGKRVAIIGAGGIGFDVAELLISKQKQSVDEWLRSWGIDRQYIRRGGLLDVPEINKPERTVYLLQRKNEQPGKRLAKTTGWIRRLNLRRHGVEMLSGVHYLSIDDFGLHIEYQGEKKALAVDQVVICAGQQSDNALYQQLKAIGQPVYAIGGARQARELDAESAIREGMELAYRL
jgi:2,4-dienoyl-CoA reductase (NADPH2)